MTSKPHMEPPKKYTTSQEYTGDGSETWPDDFRGDKEPHSEHYFGGPYGWQDIKSESRMQFATVEELESFLNWKSGRLEEQKEAADRVLAVADQLAEWCRVTTSVEGVFSNNLGAQAQAQGMANLVIRYAAARESYPAEGPKP